MPGSATSPSWASIDITDDSPAELATSQQRQRHLEWGSSPQEHFPGPEWATSNCNVSNSPEPSAATKVVIPSAKQIRQSTIDGIKIGILPEYQDYGVVIEYLVDMFVKYDFRFEEVVTKVPWLGNWLVNPFNANLLNEELEMAARLEVSRIQRQIQFMLEGGLCYKTCGRLCGCICCCLPVCAICCKVMAYFTDLFVACFWVAFCDWWLGAFCRKYIIVYICYVPRYIKIAVENCLIGESMFDDEELSIKNIYTSNSYRIANHYACLLFLAIILLALGTCIVTVSYIYLPMHEDQLFIRIQSIIGIILVTSGCCGIQFYCRCTL